MAKAIKETTKQRKARILSEDAERAKAGAPDWPFEREIGKEICFKIATTTIRLDNILAQDERYPGKEVFYKWLFESTEFSDMYRLAKERQQEIKVESQELELDRAREHIIADDKGNERIDPAAVNLARLACDNIKWEAARLAQRKFGNAKEADNPEDDRMKKVNEMVAKKRASKKRDY